MSDEDYEDFHIHLAELEKQVKRCVVWNGPERPDCKTCHHKGNCTAEKKYKWVKPFKESEFTKKETEQ